MTTPEAIKILKDHNARRRDDEGSKQSTDPTELGIAIDHIIKEIEYLTS